MYFNHIAQLRVSSYTEYLIAFYEPIIGHHSKEVSSHTPPVIWIQVAKLLSKKEKETRNSVLSCAYVTW